MALRCVLGNICRSGRRRLVENNSTRSLLKPSHKIWDDEKYKELLQDRIEYKRWDRLYCGYMYRTDEYLPHAQPTNNPNVMAFAHLAVEEFNKQKNAQLQFVRAVKAYRQCNRYGYDDEYYYLTLEATDAEAVKTYQAIVVVKDCLSDVPVVQLNMFGIVDDNGSWTLLKLYDNPVVYWPLDSRDHRPGDREITKKKEIEARLDLIANHDPRTEEFQKNKEMEAALSLC